MNVIYKEPNWKSYIVETTNPVFTPEQCNIISKIGRSMPPINAEVGAGRYATTQRLSHLSWITFNNVDAKPMYETLNQLMYITNKRHFGFDDMCINEQAQYTEYPEGGFYDWHMDSELVMKNEPPVRKISMTLVLSPESDFEGGGLELASSGKIVRPKQGHAVFFASFIQHRVVPITRGLRKSLVMWFGGEPFK